MDQYIKSLRNSESATQELESLLQSARKRVNQGYKRQLPVYGIHDYAGVPYTWQVVYGRHEYTVMWVWGRYMEGQDIVGRWKFRAERGEELAGFIRSGSEYCEVSLPPCRDKIFPKFAA
jgi:hypothetical protein